MSLDMTTNREVIMYRLYNGLLESMADDGLEDDPDSFTVGYCILATHIVKLIERLENEGVHPSEILEEIKNQMDSGPEQVLH